MSSIDSMQTEQVVAKPLCSSAEQTNRSVRSFSVGNEEIFWSLEQFCSSNNLSASSFKHLFFRSAPSISAALASSAASSSSFLDTPLSTSSGSSINIYPHSTSRKRGSHGFQVAVTEVNKKMKKMKRNTLNVETQLSVSFEESLRGGSKSLEYTQYMECTHCIRKIKIEDKQTQDSTQQQQEVKQEHSDANSLMSTDSSHVFALMELSNVCCKDEVNKIAESKENKTQNSSDINNSHSDDSNNSNCSDSNNSIITDHSNNSINNNNSDSSRNGSEIKEENANGTACEICHGSRRISKSRLIQIQVPKGVTKGLKKVIKGEGNREGEIQGDLVVEFNVDEHPFFQRDGDNALCEVHLSVFQAVLGTKIKIPSLCGKENEKVELKIEPGTQPNEVIVLRHQGFNKPNCKKKRGDLHVTVRVEIPRNITAEQRELFERLAAIDSILHLSRS